MENIIKTPQYEWKLRLLPKLVSRDVKFNTSSDQDVNNVTVITGFRRVGKTYLLFKKINEFLKTYPKEEVIYIYKL